MDAFGITILSIILIIVLSFLLYVFVRRKVKKRLWNEVYEGIEKAFACLANLNGFPYHGKTGPPE